MMREESMLRVLRTNPQIEMGYEGFIEEVYSLTSSKVFFFLLHNGHFYLMDESKKIRVL